MVTMIIQTPFGVLCTGLLVISVTLRRPTHVHDPLYDDIYKFLKFSKFKTQLHTKMPLPISDFPRYQRQVTHHYLLMACHSSFGLLAGSWLPQKHSEVVWSWYQTLLGITFRCLVPNQCCLKWNPVSQESSRSPEQECCRYNFQHHNTKQESLQIWTLISCVRSFQSGYATHAKQRLNKT